jgi:hypothetical protein
MKNDVFWDIKTPYFTGDTLRLRYRVQPVNALLRFEIFTTVTMKNDVFWDIKTPYFTGDT